MSVKERSCRFGPFGEDCFASATWHGLKIKGPDGGVFESASCDVHKPQMEAAADYVHPMGELCGLAASRFQSSENRCYAPQDEPVRMTEEVGRADG